MRSFAKGFKKISLVAGSTLFVSMFFLAQTACATATPDASKSSHHHKSVTMPDGLYINSDHQMVVPFILSAHHSLDIEIYQLTDPAFVAAVRTQIKNGVRVRVVKEPAPVGDKCLLFSPVAANEDAICADQRQLKAEIIAAGGSYVPFNKAALCGTPAPTPGQATPTTTAAPVCFEHGKMILADRTSVLISTGNFNSSNLCNLANNPDRCNRDFSVITHRSDEVSALNAVFAKDLLQVHYDINSIISSVPDMTVSPESFAPLVAFINSAHSSIRIENQYLNFAPLNDALLAAAARGVKVQVMVASLCAFGRPTAADINKATRIYGGFEQAGIESRMFTTAIKVNGVDGYLHAKAIVVDDSRVWVGSVNGSNAAINVNREFGLFLTDAASVNTLKHSFDHDFADAGAETWRESTTCAKDFASVPQQAQY